jgi:outer membrane protein TolC
MNNHVRLFSYDTAEFQLSQKIPLSGNRDRRRAAATAEAEVSAAAIRTRAFLLEAAARDAFFQLLRTRGQLALIAASDRLFVQAADLVRSRLAAGSAQPAALLAAERERAQLHERLAALERDAADASATLNTLRDLSPQSPIGDLAPPAVTPVFATLEEAQAHALAHRPELREADARITAALRTEEVAARAWHPDPEVTLKTRHLDGTGRVVSDYDTGFSISVPWANGDKYHAAQREAARRREAATLDAAALRTRTAGEIREMWTRRETACRNVELYRDRLLPLARQSSDSLRLGLVAGKSSLTELVAAQRALIDTQATLAGYEADLLRAESLLATLAAADPS